MRFRPTDDQRDFADALDALLSGADTPTVARAWAAGDPTGGLALWRRLANLGVAGLLVPEAAGGAGAGPVELVLAFEMLGRHAVPGPWVEAAAFLPVLLADDSAPDLLRRVAGGTVVSVAVPPFAPYVLDADAAEEVFVASDGRLRPCTAGEPVASLDPTRRLFAVTYDAVDPRPRPNALLDDALDHAALAAAAHLLGAGERVLADTVAYVKQRTQFGRPVGSYQAVKHSLADVRIALDFARPLAWGAALSLTASSRTRARDVSAAKVAAGEAAYLSARAGLQAHGAIGYTAECDLGLWLLRIRALRGAWGTPTWHRERIQDQLADSDPFGTRWTVDA